MTFTGVPTMVSRNNLKNMRTYLIGAMDRVHDGGIGWRNKITPHLQSMNLTILDPCNKPVESSKEDIDTRNTIDYLKSIGSFDKIRDEYGHIRNADLRCVDVSDFVIAHIDLSIHACGSYEEIVTANRQKKPVLIWCEQGKEYAPNWLFFMLPHECIFGSMNDLLNYLQHINTHQESHTLDRWFFFNQLGDS
jgi:hypothetical protein